MLSSFFNSKTEISNKNSNHYIAHFKDEFEVTITNKVIQLKPTIDRLNHRNFLNIFLLNKINIINKNEKIEVELIPNNFIIVSLYLLLALVNIKSDLASNTLISIEETVLVSMVMFSAFILANMMLIKRKICLILGKE